MNAEHITKEEQARRRKNWILSCGYRYWPSLPPALTDLSAPNLVAAPTGRQIEIPLPEWAADLGVGSPPFLLVDEAAVTGGDGNLFTRCDWMAAAFFHLVGSREDARGDSYALPRRTDARLHEHAWVNRIFLVLRRIAAHRTGTSESSLCGKLPQAVFHITHDVDAVRKTLEIRLKQTAFHIFNTIRAGVKGDWRLALDKLKQATRFFFTTPQYWNFDAIQRLERERGLRSTFNFYGGPAGWRRGSPRRMLLDPGYDIAHPTLRQLLACLRDGGWRIGVHPSYDAWGDPAAIRRERAAVEAVSGVPVTECRQHWLRFDGLRSWRAQEESGLELDTTLGFNDRPAFRNGAALRFHPWDENAERPLRIAALPMILMDSHFYDYNPMTDAQRAAALARWVGEVRAVGGEASVNWHVHTLAPDYGWETGYRELLNLMT